ncbi:MAG: hypothetical protein M5T61_21520 [Acidimicrobiia bacterium]|nr:hypothetical protein [Acidimicrobiia bacterium]
MRDRIVLGERREARRYDRIVAAISTAVWVMEPNALQTLLDIVAERHGGYRASREEIQERIGIRQEPDLIPAESKVAVIRVHGTIAPRAEDIENSSSTGVGIDRVLSEFRAALADPEKTAVMLDIDSPGGAAQGIPEAFAEIRAAKGKPVVAQVTGMAPPRRPMARRRRRRDHHDPVRAARLRRRVCRPPGSLRADGDEGGSRRRSSTPGSTRSSGTRSNRCPRRRRRTCRSGSTRSTTTSSARSRRDETPRLRRSGLTSVRPDAHREEGGCRRDG